MELKFVIPNMAKSLGNLEFGGPAEVKRGDTRRNGTQTRCCTAATSCSAMCSVRMILRS